MAVYTRSRQNPKKWNEVTSTPDTEGFDTDFSDAKEYHATANSNVTYAGDSLKAAGWSFWSTVKSAAKTVASLFTTAYDFISGGVTKVYNDGHAKEIAVNAKDTFVNAVKTVGNLADATLEGAEALYKVSKGPVTEIAQGAKNIVSLGVEGALDYMNSGNTTEDNFIEMDTFQQDLGILLDGADDSLFTQVVDLVARPSLFGDDTEDQI